MCVCVCVCARVRVCACARVSLYACCQALATLRDITLGLLYFQQNDPSVPETVRKEALECVSCVSCVSYCWTTPFMRVRRRAMSK